MIRRLMFALVLSLFGAAALQQAGVLAQSGPGTEVPRGIRRDVPMTNAIRRAFDAGTRDASGQARPELLAAADRLHDQRAASTRPRRR